MDKMLIKLKQIPYLVIIFVFRSQVCLASSGATASTGASSSENLGDAPVSHPKDLVPLAENVIDWGLNLIGII